jgi:hypothetical protein
MLQPGPGCAATAGARVKGTHIWHPQAADEGAAWPAYQRIRGRREEQRLHAREAQKAHEPLHGSS